MAVYVDSASLAWRGKRWCHLVANSVDELHAFAAQLGLRREWFQSPLQYPHYDVTMAVREKALRLGALEADKQTIVDCCEQLRFELRAFRKREREALAHRQEASANAVQHVSAMVPT